MFIVPYFLKKPVLNTDFNLVILWIFLSGGVNIWETDEENCSEKFIVDNYLTPNGIFGKVQKMTNTTLFFEIDERTDIDSFYTMTDFLKNNTEVTGVDIFRPFVWLGDSKVGERDEWGWYEECEKVSLGKFGNLGQLWTSISELGLSES
jgi:hypothetical protein